MNLSFRVAGQELFGLELGRSAAGATVESAVRNAFEELFIDTADENGECATDDEFVRNTSIDTERDVTDTSDLFAGDELEDDGLRVRFGFQ